MAPLSASYFIQLAQLTVQRLRIHKRVRFVSDTTKLLLEQSFTKTTCIEYRLQKSHVDEQTCSRVAPPSSSEGAKKTFFLGKGYQQT